MAIVFNLLIKILMVMAMLPSRDAILLVRVMWFEEETLADAFFFNFGICNQILDASIIFITRSISFDSVVLSLNGTYTRTAFETESLTLKCIYRLESIDT